MQPVELRAACGPRTLVIPQAKVGDIVQTQMLLALLRRCDPACALDVLAPAWAEPLLRRMPEAARLWPRPPSRRLALGQRLALARRLRGQYVQAIVMAKSAKAALAPWLARIPVRIGFDRAEAPWLMTEVRARPQEAVARMRRMAPPDAPPNAPLPRLVCDRAQAARCARDLGLDPAADAVALCPGASASAVHGATKRWGTARYAELGARLARAGQTVWVLGLACDRGRGAAICAAVARTGGDAANLCGATSLDQAIDLLSLCRLAVCNDSGLLHVAAAVGAPALGIYGSSDPRMSAPLSARSATVSAGLPCSPCWDFHRCAYGTIACMERVQCDAVAAAARELLGEAP